MNYKYCNKFETTDKKFNINLFNENKRIEKTDENSFY